MQSYYEMQKSRNTNILPESDLKVEAEAIKIEAHAFKECACIPRSLRKTAIDQTVLELVQASNKITITLLSMGSGDLGQEYHINQLLTENGIYVQWLLIDKIYGRTEKSWDLLKAFKRSIEDTGSGVLGAYSDISGYAAFKLGRTAFSNLNKSGTHQHLFNKSWSDLMTDHPLNGMIFNRKHKDFSSNPLPAIDFVLAIDMNPSGISGYQKTKELTDLSIDAALYLNPDATCLSVLNKNAFSASHVSDLEISTVEPNKKLSFWPH